MTDNPTPPAAQCARVLAHRILRRLVNFECSDKHHAIVCEELTSALARALAAADAAGYQRGFDAGGAMATDAATERERASL